MSMYDKMERQLKSDERFKMEPLPVDPRIKSMYPEMGEHGKVLDAVQILRDKAYDTINDRMIANEPPSEQELAALLETKPGLNTDNPDILQAEVQRYRQAQMLYGTNKGTATFDEVEAAKKFVISDGITPQNKRLLEQAADAWRDTHGSWAGWDAKREEMIHEMVFGEASPVVDPKKEAFQAELAELITKYTMPEE